MFTQQWAQKSLDSGHAQRDGFHLLRKLNLVVFGGSLCFFDTIEDNAWDVLRQCGCRNCSLVATECLLTPGSNVCARLNQLLVLMSDSAIGFPNQVAACPWLKLDESSTRFPGRPSLETTPSLRQAWSTRISIIQIRLQKGHDVF